MFGLKKKEKKVDEALMSEKEVLEALEIPSFKKMKKEKVKDFAALIPKMDPEVTKTALRQSPHFVQTANEVVAYYKDLTTKILTEKKAATAHFETFDSIICALNELLKENKLSFRHKKKIVDKIMELAKMKETLQIVKGDTINKALIVAGTVAVSIIGLVGKIVKTIKK